MALDFLNDIWGAINPTQGSNALGWLAGAGDLFKLGAGINNQIQQGNTLDQYNATASRGPRVQDYYAPMSNAEAQAYTRGVGANAQQNIPPQSAAFSDLLGNSLASRESDRYQQAYRQAFADWQQRMGARSNIYGQTGAQGMGGFGQGLSQFLLYKQLMDAANRGSQPGQTYDPSKVGQQFMPDPYGYGGGIPQGTFGAGALQDPTQRGGGGASPFASGQFTDVNDANPAFFGGP